MEVVQEIAFEIKLLWHHDPDINDPQETHVLRSLLGRAFWRIKGLAEQEYGPQNPITKKPARIREDAQKMLRK